MSPVVWGFLGSLAAGLATAIGAVPILVRGRSIADQKARLLGFASGVMLAASFFSLIVPALDAGRAQGLGSWSVSALVTGCVLAGAAGLAWLNRVLPSLDIVAQATGGAIDNRHRSTCFLILAITLHNFPEGAAVGLSFADGSLGSGIPTAVGIGIQNIPEGLAVAGALATIGYRRRICALGALASGLVEPVAGLVSALLVTLATVLLPAGLAMAAGAMLYIVIAQILPDLAQDGESAEASRAFFIGLALMLFFDTALA